METQELIESLKNVSINSETAEAIAKEYFRLEYIKMLTREIAAWTVLFFMVIGIRAVWKKCKEHL